MCQRLATTINCGDEAMNFVKIDWTLNLEGRSMINDFLICEQHPLQGNCCRSDNLNSSGPIFLTISKSANIWPVALEIRLSGVSVARWRIQCRRTG